MRHPEYKEVRKLRVFLLNAKGQTVAELTKKSYNYQRKLVFNGLDEFSFTIPFKTEINHRMVENPSIKKLNSRNKIRLRIYNENHEKIVEEEYIVVTKTKSFGETEEINVTCKSSAYELNRNFMFEYKPVAYNCTALLTDCLKDTNWSIGYVNTEFDTVYRSFEISSKTKLEFLNDIVSTFDAVVIYDTINKAVNFYKEDEVSVNKGMRLKHAQYINSLDESVDEDEIITRLYARGKDGLTLNGINPTGQSYIDNFSYFYSVMSDDLRETLLTYNEKLNENSDTVANLLSEKKTLQESLTEQNNKLTTLENEKQIILDNIEIAKNGGNPRGDLTDQLNTKISEIKAQETLIESTNQSISDIETTTTNTATALSYESNLTSSQLKELINFINVAEWSDDNITEEKDLLKEGKKYLQENCYPKIDITTSILNFFECPSEWHNWDRFNKGDIVSIVVDPIGTNVKARIQELNINYEEVSIDVVISNVISQTKTPDEVVGGLLIDNINTNKTYKSTKVEVEAATRNFNARNDRLTTKPIAPTFKYDDSDVTYRYNDNGSVDITVTWQYPNFEETQNDAHNIDGFEVFLYTDTTSEVHVFGSNLASYDKNSLSYQNRTYSFTGKVSNKWYTMGIRAYRVVDPDVNKNRIIYSEIVNFPETPYRPSDEVAMKGSLDGALAGTVNGSYYSIDNIEPKNPKENDKWTDTSGDSPVDKVYKGNEWTVVGSGVISNQTDIYIMPPPSDLETNSKNLQFLLDKTLDKSKRIIIKFNEGIYDIYTCYIHSNTTLSLHENTVIRWNNKRVLNPETGNMVSMSSIFMTARAFHEEDSNFTGYNGNGNILIEGGQSIGGCFLTMIHGYNITIRNMKFIDTSADHAFQVNSSKNVLIENCEFIGHTQRADNRQYVELIQVDWCTSTGVPGWVSTAPIYDHTIVDGLTIRNCTFRKSETVGVNDYIHTAIGSHSSDGDLKNQNIKIENCKFYNHKYAGLTLHRMDNVLVEKCVFDSEYVDANNIDNRMATNVKVVMNIFHGARRSIYSTDVSNLIFNKNTIHGGYLYPVYIQDNVFIAEIKENQFIDISDNTASSLIAIRNATQFIVADNQASNCIALGNNNSFVNVYGVEGGKSSNGTIYNNKLDNYENISKEINLDYTTVENVKFDTETNNLTWCSIGDSITNGSTYGYYQDYALPLIKKIRTHYKRGYNGHTASISANGSYDSIIEHVNEIETADVYTVFLGTNDFSRNIPIGTIDDDIGQTDSIYGGLKQLYVDLTTKNPLTTIIFITPIKRDGYLNWDVENTAGFKLTDYVEAIKKFANNYGCPLIDLFNESGISNRTVSTYLYDGLHPNLIGNQRIGRIIGNKISQYI